MIKNAEATVVMTSARSRILDTAQELFYHRGFRAVGIDEIIARSEVAKATLYANFGSKDRLVAAYLQRHSEECRVFLEAEARDVQGGARTKIDHLFQLVERGCANPAFRGCPFINFAVEFPDRSAAGWEVCLAHRAWLRGLVASLAAEGGASDPTLLAEQWCQLYDAAMVGSVFDGTGAAASVARTMADNIVSAALNRTIPDPMS